MRYVLCNEKSTIYKLVSVNLFIDVVFRYFVIVKISLPLHDSPVLNQNRKIFSLECNSEHAHLLHVPQTVKCRMNIDFEV